jgi:site-specific DNA-methyltransferase (adenine-specific)
MKYPDDFINKVICGDCLEVMKDIPDKSVDCLITDPPYNYKINGGGSLRKKYSSYQKQVNELGYFDVKKFLEIVKPKLRIFNAYIWCGKETLLDIANWVKEKKMNWNILFWYKPNPLPAYNNTYLPDTEYCIFIRETQATWNKGLGYENYRKKFEFPIGNTGFNHPTVKPIEIMKSHIIISTKENDIILDPFLGSGTTAVACKYLKRNFIGIEISPKYCEIAKGRLRQEVLF